MPWHKISELLQSQVHKVASTVAGKFTFGMSVLGLSVSPKDIERTTLHIKKSLRSKGKSARAVTARTPLLNAAQVIRNGLVTGRGMELLVISDGKSIIIARTIHVQDIDAYAARDQARPKRDAKVGMLPPKLAQIIINLAVNRHPHIECVLDPFCGTGVVLQETLLMDIGAYGTDIEPRMVAYSTKNLAWLQQHYPKVTADNYYLDVLDATTGQWLLDSWHGRFAIAGESYLGRPLSTLPPPDHLRKILHESNTVNATFLQNISQQIHKGTRLCIAVPVWRKQNDFIHLPAIDHLTDMGYTRVRFKHVADKDLIYHRENQVVGRELLVLEKR